MNYKSQMLLLADQNNEMFEYGSLSMWTTCIFAWRCVSYCDISLLG